MTMFNVYYVGRSSGFRKQFIGSYSTDIVAAAKAAQLQQEYRGDDDRVYFVLEAKESSDEQPPCGR